MGGSILPREPTHTVDKLLELEEMKTDRELLELAAKAAGVCVEFDKDGDPYIDDPIGGFSGLWNPLTDDGDALRLAVEIGLELLMRRGVKGDTTTVLLPCELDMESVFERHVECKFKATRLAIVRAAAKVGEINK